MILNKLTSRIVFIENEDVTRDSSGGVMSYLLNLSKYFRSKGFKTILFGSGHILDVNISNNKFSKFYSISLNSSISNLRYFLKLFKTNELKKIGKEDIIHVQRPEMVIPLAIRKKNKIICTLHGGQDMAVLKKKGKVIGFFYLILQFISFTLVDELIVVDKNNMDRYLKKYFWIKNKINLIPISVDTSRYCPQDKLKVREKFNLPLDEKIILFIGRLEYEKNVEFIINSFKKIEKYNSKLVIVGSGSLDDKLRKNAETHKDQILFFGELDNKLIPEIINCADVMILASFFEGSPTVIKEALCCNVPVISTDVGDVREVIESVNGGEIIDFTVDSFLIAIHKILAKKSIEIVGASNLFNYESMGEKTLKIYYNHKND